MTNKTRSKKVFLTKKEVEILYLLAKLVSKEKIAKMLSCKISDLQVLLDKIVKKLKCNSEVNILSKAMEMGIINSKIIESFQVPGTPCHDSSLVQWYQRTNRILVSNDDVGGFPAYFSQKEIEILCCLAAKLTNNDIAVLYDNTRKSMITIIYNIYMKLYVGSRDEAVERARKLGIIDDETISKINLTRKISNDEKGDSTEKRSYKGYHDFWDESRGLTVSLNDTEMSVIENIETYPKRESLAAKLMLSINTVSQCISSIYLKLGAHKREDCIKKAYELGILKREGVE